MKMIGNGDSPLQIQFTLSTTSSKLPRSSHTSAMKQILQDKILRQLARESLPLYLLTGHRRQGKEVMQMVSFGLKGFIMWKRCDVRTRIMVHVTTKAQIGQQRKMHGLHSMEFNTMAVGRCNFLGTTTMDSFLTFLHLALTTVKWCSYSSQSSFIRTELLECPQHFGSI